MSATKMTTIAASVPADLAERIERLAEKNGRTVQQEIRCALREHVERQEELGPAR